VSGEVRQGYAKNAWYEARPTQRDNPYKNRSSRPRPSFRLTSFTFGSTNNGKASRQRSLSKESRGRFKEMICASASRPREDRKERTA